MIKSKESIKDGKKRKDPTMLTFFSALFTTFN